MEHSKTAEALNDLIDVCKDGEEGFETAMQGASSANLRSLFNKYSTQRANFALELQTEVAKLGDKPETQGSVRGAMHRGWINIKSAVTGHDDKAIIDECETGEDVAVQTYERVLQDGHLQGRVRDLVEKQFVQVKAAHDSIRALQLQYADRGVA